jgi:hypothetical protein
LISFLPDREFRRCVERYQGDIRLRGFSCWDQYLAMAFAQLTYRESLRDIEACLRSMQGKLYHLGFRGKVARSTLADANESHDWRIFADFAQILIAIAASCRDLSHWRSPLYLIRKSYAAHALDTTNLPPEGTLLKYKEEAPEQCASSSSKTNRKWRTLSRRVCSRKAMR